MGFAQSTADECIYIKKTRESTSIITIYVDDLGTFHDIENGHGRAQK